MDRLKKRAQFLAVGRGLRSPRRGFVLQSLTLPEAAAPAACGFTLTKKVGNAVMRNRIRRRLREAVRLEAERIERPGRHHVLIGRREALGLDFATLRADLVSAFRKAHEALDRGSDPASSRSPRGPKGTGRGRGEPPGTAR